MYVHSTRLCGLEIIRTDKARLPAVYDVIPASRLAYYLHLGALFKGFVNLGILRIGAAPEVHFGIGLAPGQHHAGAAVHIRCRILIILPGAYGRAFIVYSARDVLRVYVAPCTLVFHKAPAIFISVYSNLGALGQAREFLCTGGRTLPHIHLGIGFSSAYGVVAFRPACILLLAPRICFRHLYIL